MFVFECIARQWVSPPPRHEFHVRRAAGPDPVFPRRPTGNRRRESRLVVVVVLFGHGAHGLQLALTHGAVRVRLAQDLCQKPHRGQRREHGPQRRACTGRNRNGAALQPGVRMHLHECHGELSRLYGRLDSEDLRNELDPMDIALMDSIARTVHCRAGGATGTRYQSARCRRNLAVSRVSELIWTLCELIHLRPSTVSVAAGVVQWALTLECWFDRTPFPAGFTDEELEQGG